MVASVLATCVAVAIIGLVIKNFLDGLVDSEYTSVTEYAGLHDMETIVTRDNLSPRSSYSTTTGKYAFGRYRRPITNMNLHELTTPQKLFQKKEFVWTSMSNADWFVGSALLQFGYTSAAIVYVYDIRNNESHVAHTELPLLSFLGATFEGANDTDTPEQEHGGTLSGCAKWPHAIGSLSAASKCFVTERNAYEVRLAGQFRDGMTFRIDYDILLGEDDAMAMIFPIGPKRPSVVNKLGGARVEGGTLVLKSKESEHEQVVRLENALGMMDFTRGLLRRLTLWHWTALSWTDLEGVRYGLQLSEGTYDNERGISLESTLWKNGRANHVNSRIVYTQLDKTLPPHKSEWTVRAADGSVDLRFVPAEVILGSFHYGVIDGDLYHIWGTYSGIVHQSSDGSQSADSLISLNNIAGTLEDHYALW